MMEKSAEEIAKALGKAKRVGPRTWRCLCPAHSDSPALGFCWTLD